MNSSHVSQPSASQPGASQAGASRRWAAGAALARRHGLLVVLLAAGLTLRILAEAAYRPALLYIDSYKYLYHTGGNDPAGYRALLKPVLAVANLDTVAAVQHLLGLGMAVALYALLLRRGAPRWLAALATAPVLLDGYQLQAEQTIMPDVLFEALIVAGLVLLLWRPDGPRLWTLAAAGLLLGASATVAQVGQVLVLPAVAYAAARAVGWRRLGHAALIAVAFLVPILAYDSANLAIAGHFRLASGGVTTFYGRMGVAADCPALKLPAGERALCPSRAQAYRLGPDGLEHSQSSPLRPYYRDLPSYQATRLVSAFNRQVLEQQPLRVLGSIAGDAAKLFAVHRVTSHGDTAIQRWQFQDHYPQFPPYVTVRGGTIRIGQETATVPARPVFLGTTRSIGGGAAVSTPLARFLRAYQLDGGFTPGPALLIMVLAGLAGTLALLTRRRWLGAEASAAVRACGTIFAAGVCVLLVSDATEFSWRYQLPALITLPPAAALAIAAVLAWRRHRRSVSPGTPAGAPAGQPGEAETAPSS